MKHLKIREKEEIEQFLKDQKFRNIRELAKFIDFTLLYHEFNKLEGKTSLHKATSLWCKWTTNNYIL